MGSAQRIFRIPCAGESSSCGLRQNQATKSPMSNTIFELPVSVLYQVLNDWLPLTCLGRLDSASGGTPQLHALFLQFLSASENIFSAKCRSSMLYIDNYMNWVVLRSVKVSSVQFPPLCGGIPNAVAAPFFAATGHHIKQITSDAEDNTSLLTVYPFIQTTCSNLEVLEINHPSSIYGVFKILEICQDSIRELSLKGSNSGRDNVSLDRIFCPNMQSLRFEGTGLAGQFVSTVLQGCPNLEVLQCARLKTPPATHAVPEGLHFIANILYPCLHLRVLDVSETSITDAGLAKLAQFCPNITSVTASCCSVLSDAGITALITHCRNIQELSISDNSHFTDQSMAAIGATYSAALTSLDIGECRRMTGAAIASAVAQCRLLKSLNLKGNSRLLEDQLISCIQCCGALEVLVADAARTTDKVLCAITEHCPLLRRLSLKTASGSSYSAQGVHALLKQATQLRELVVSSQSTVVNELSAILIEESYPHLKVTRDSRAHRMLGAHTTFEVFDLPEPFGLFDPVLVHDLEPTVPLDYPGFDEIDFDIDELFT